MSIGTFCSCASFVRGVGLMVLASIIFMQPMRGHGSETLGPNDRMLVLCDRFVDLSIEWTRKALQENCPIALSDKPGSPWGTNPDSHYQWCLAQKSEMMLNARLAARQAEFETCLSDKSRARQASAEKPDNQTCFLYAKRAFAQASEARALDCGFEGKRWLADFAFHREQCANQMTVFSVEAETQSRLSDLRQCESMRNVPIK